MIALAANTLTGLAAGAEQLLAALLMMALAVALLVLEVLIVSFGLFGILAVGAATYGIVLAFDLGPLAGWSFLLVSPVIAVVVLRWGLRRLGRSSIVPQSEISGSSGAREITQRLGIDLGTEGRLTTHARPGGRAHFPGGECDVQVVGGALDRGTVVVVKRIDGPMVFVVAAAPPGAPPETPVSGQE